MEANSSSTQAAASTKKQTVNNTTTDISAMMEQIAKLEDEKKRLNDELQMNVTKVKNLTKKTQSEMQGKFDTVVSTWLDGLAGKDENKVQEFKNGLQRLVTDTREDSGIWSVVCCASENHAANVAEKERLRVENEELKHKLNGSFIHEEQRIDTKKRKAENEPDTSGNIWDDFAEMMKKDNGVEIV